MELKAILFNVDWIHLAQGRHQWRAFMITIMNFRVPYIARNIVSDSAIFGFSKQTQLHGVN
jgi:hypothetical protein